MALVVVENADDAVRMAQFQTLGQGEEPACVLGGDDIGGFDRPPHPRARIAEVADRSSDQDESPACAVIIGGSVSAIGRGGADTGVTSVVRVRAWLIIAVWHACHLLLTTAAAPVRAECTVRLCPVPHHVIGLRPGAGTCPPAQFPPEQLSSAPGAPCRVLRAGIVRFRTSIYTRAVVPEARPTHDRSACGPHTRPNAATQFWPPKPKAFVIAFSTRTSRAELGT